jgi:hypothetical protein
MSSEYRDSFDFLNEPPAGGRESPPPADASRISISRELRETSGLAGSAGNQPDFVAAVLGNVDQQRPFLSSSSRRWLTGVRFAMCAAMLAAVVVAAVAVRYAQRPEVITGRPTPIGGLVQSVTDQAVPRLSARVSVQLQGVTHAPELNGLGALDDRLLVRPVGFVGPMMPLADVLVREDAAVRPARCASQHAGRRGVLRPLPGPGVVTVSSGTTRGGSGGSDGIVKTNWVVAADFDCAGWLEMCGPRMSDETWNKGRAVVDHDGHAAANGVRTLPAVELSPLMLDDDLGDGFAPR